MYSYYLLMSNETELKVKVKSAYKLNSDYNLYEITSDLRSKDFYMNIPVGAVIYATSIYTDFKLEPAYVKKESGECLSIALELDHSEEDYLDLLLCPNDGRIPYKVYVPLSLLDDYSIKKLESYMV